MKNQSITVTIPPEMSDSDECYSEVTGYVAACTGFDLMPDELDDVDGISCDAYFEDDKGNIWHGQLHSPPYPDGSRKYVIALEKKRENNKKG